MKKNISLITSSVVTGVAIAGVMVSPVLACHPQGTIVKEVQDNTTNSAMVDANSAENALMVNQGDVLTYTVTVSNRETQEGSKHQADMVNTMLTDTLPAGVELVGSPSQRQISENIGTIKANGSTTKQYQVKVTETEDGAVLTNKACFRATSNLGKSDDQSGCDTAIVKVHVPPTPTPTPVPTPTPTPIPTPTTPAPQPTVLPNTGAGNFIAPAAILSVLGYAGYLLRLKRRAA